MKKLTYLLSVGALFMLFAAIGCGSSDDGPTEEEQQKAALLGTWNATSVSDGTSRDDYDDFTIQFTESSYSTAGGPDLLPLKPSGTWSFGTNVKNDITLGGQAANYSINGSTLTISFDYSGSGFTNAKVESVEGSWTFTFSKQ